MFVLSCGEKDVMQWYTLYYKNNKNDNNDDINDYVTEYIIWDLAGSTLIVNLTRHAPINTGFHFFAMTIWQKMQYIASNAHFFIYISRDHLFNFSEHLRQVFRNFI